MDCEASLKALFVNSMAYYCYDNAIFFAERLYYESQNEANLFNLADCYYRQGKYHQCYLLLQGSTIPNNRFLLAKTCFTIGKYEEAELALLPRRFKSAETLTEEEIESIPGGVFGIYHLGLICRKQQRNDSAIDYFHLCIKINPSMWCAFVQLCDLGVFINIPHIFGTEALQAVRSLHENSDGEIKSETTSALLEKLSGGDGQSPKLTYSLGFSSNSLRAPLTSPGTVPHARKNLSISQSFRNSRVMDPLRDSDLGISGPTHDRQDLFGLTTPSSMIMNQLSTPLDNSVSRHSRRTVRSTLVRPNNLTNSSHNDSLHMCPNNVNFSTITDICEVSDDLNLSNSQCQSFEASRRVSFGPTAQQTISEYSHGKFAAINDEHPWKYPRVGGTPNNLSQATFSQSMLGSTVGPVSPIPIALTPNLTSSASFSHIDLPDMSSRFSQLTKGEHSIHMDFEALGTPFSSRKHGLGNRLDYESSGVNVSSEVPTNNDILESNENENENEDSRNKYQPSKLHYNELGTSSIPMETLSPRCMTLIASFIGAYQLLSRYQCQDCIDFLHHFPISHFQSGLIHQFLGRAYFEMNNHKSALVAFREMLRLEPFRMNGVELMSTSLWQLKKEQELFALAQRVVDIDRYCPETWCVVGNSYSLQRDREMALKLFQRSIQIDPGFAYAHSLCGHEYINNEDFEQAIFHFRQALVQNDRHYLAWSGLGSIYYRQEKFELAVQHFRKASSINPSSSIISCYLGMFLFGLKTEASTLEALDVLSTAIAKDKSNPQLLFQRAHILVSLNQYEQALKDFEVSRRLAPKEPQIYVKIGRVYQKMGRYSEALQNYQIALNLDPKDSFSVKEDIDSLPAPNLEDILAMVQHVGV